MVFLCYHGSLNSRGLSVRLDFAGSFSLWISHYLDTILHRRLCTGRWPGPAGKQRTRFRVQSWLPQPHTWNVTPYPCESVKPQRFLILILKKKNVFHDYLMNEKAQVRSWIWNIFEKMKFLCLHRLWGELLLICLGLQWTSGTYIWGSGPGSSSGWRWFSLRQSVLPGTGRVVSVLSFQSDFLLLLLHLAAQRCSPPTPQTQICSSLSVSIISSVHECPWTHSFLIA